MSLIGEVFNLYNKANLTGYSGDLTSSAFGQPTSRATQVFGSGGPRAFQLAMRVELLKRSAGMGRESASNASGETWRRANRLGAVLFLL